MQEHLSTLLPGDSLYNQVQRYEPASRKQRLVNYLVDTILYYLFLFELLKYSGAIIAGNTASDITQPQPRNAELLLLLAYLGLPVLYTLVEAITKGRSPGKYLTGTMAVRADLSPITFGQAIGRSLLRMLPFDPISGITGTPFHDMWSRTMVVKKKSIVY